MAAKKSTATKAPAKPRTPKPRATAAQDTAEGAAPAVSVPASLERPIRGVGDETEEQYQARLSAYLKARNAAILAGGE